MELTILVDNNTLLDKYLFGEPGLSIFINDEKIKVLFDLGYSHAFLINACKLGIGLRNIDYLVLSHSHLDHTWGLPHLVRHFTEAKIEGLEYKRPTLITHPDTFISRRLDKYDEVGSIVSKKQMTKHFELKLSKKPVWINERLVFLGEIERNNDFESQEPIGQVIRNGVMEDDYVIEDSAMAYKTEDGIVIITGCSHSGICNIIEKAISVTGEDRIVDIIGGFHLQNPSEKQLKGTLEYMEKLGPKNVHACHCTDFASKIALAKHVNILEAGCGLKLKY